ncbi:glycosyltransferase [Eggerthellaceae bacterium zg-893]|nr:glycosyltransferase [Eggerthellaceae bacterium zg-893]
MESVCVFTPTYNRAYCLDQLFHSLERQTNKDFYWLIVDDGSTDDTESLVERFQKKETLHIEYIKKENGGKQRAHNTGVAACTSELFFCVDSDDFLVDDAIESILNLWDSIKGNDKIGGIVGLDGPDKDTPLKNGMPKNVKETTFWKLYNKQHHKGDVALIYRTDILRQYPFYVYDDEKFISECYMYHQVDQHYSLGVLDKVLIVCEYREDGYTKHIRKVTRENPKGYILLKRNCIEHSDTFYLKFTSTILYLVGHILAGHTMRQGIEEAPYPGIARLASPFALLLAKTEFQKS